MNTGISLLQKELKEKARREGKDNIPIEWVNAMDNARRMEGELDLQGDKNGKSQF